MKVLRAIGTLLILLAAVAACGGGGSKGSISLPSQTDGNGDESDLKIVTYTASPTTGGSPLGVNFIVTITGGELPFTYMWDFDNDGAFDFYVNEVARRTEQSYHLYYLRNADVLQGSSLYQAVVRVKDNAGVVRTSEPVSILITDVPQFALDSALTRIISDTVVGYDQEGQPIYAYLSGEPVYCRVFPDPSSPGTPPYRFQWDFDGDGRIDSTLQNPQYTFTVLEGESESFIVNLTVTDSNDYSITRQFPLTVIRHLPEEPTGPPELIVNSAPPIRPDGTILIEFDSASDFPADREPHMNASVTVSPDHPGVLPYAYFWDFTNDGIYDANTTSVSVPYYDSDLNISINPYNTFGQATRDFTLALHFVDGIGQIVHLEWPVRVVDRAYEPVVDPLLTEATVDINNDGVYDVLEDGTYAEQASTVALASDLVVHFQVAASGVTERPGLYRFQIDILGNGVYAEDINEGDSDNPIYDQVLEWDPDYDGIYEDVDLDGDSETLNEATVNITPQPGGKEIAIFEIKYPANLLPGYKAVRTKVIATSESGLEMASRVNHVPVSLVVPSSIDFSATGDPFRMRRDFGMAAVTVIDDNGTPDLTDDFLSQRRVFLVGGMDGNVALRSVQLLTQEALVTTGEWVGQVSVSDRLPLSTPRGQLAAEPLGGFTRGANSVGIYAIGGINNVDQTLSVVEMLPSFDGDGTDYPTVPWTTVGSIGNNNTQLRLMSSAYGVSYGGGSSLIVIGGLQGNPPGEYVSGTGWVFRPQDNAWFSSAISPMPTPRYDFAAVLDFPYLYAIGGRSNAGVSTRTVERVRLDTGGWEIMPDMKFSRAGAAAEIINGKIYVYGGVDYPQDKSAPEYIGTSEVFNPDTYVWSKTVGPAQGRAGAGSAALFTYLDAEGNPMPNDTVWIMGGETANGPIGTLAQLYIEGVGNID